MTIAQSTPPQSAPAHPAALAMAAGQQAPRPLPETAGPATDNAAPEVAAVAVLGYN